MEDKIVNTSSKLDERQQIYQAINNKEIVKTDEGKIRMAIFRSTTCGLLGEGCTSNPNESYKYKDRSLFGKISGWMSSPYAYPPASGLAWAHYSLDKAGFIPKSYAAEGVGFSSIKGYINIWKLFRDISFVLLVVIMLIVGFLIMFRVKLDGSTAVTIESILPRIVVTLIMISFSFAIVGLLIDVMYFLIGLAVDLIMGYGQGADAATVAKWQNEYVGAKFNDLWPTGQWAMSLFSTGNALWDVIPVEFRVLIDGYFIKFLTPLIANLSMLNFVNFLDAPRDLSILGFGIGDLPELVKGALGIIISGVLSLILPGIIIGLILVMTILLLMFRLFFIMLNSYIKLILYLIFAPVILIMNVFPGQSSFSWWIRNVIGELIVFPTVVVIMLVGNAIMAANTGSFSFFTDSLEGSRFINPSNATFTLPFLYGFRPEDFNMIVGLGIVLLIPDFIKMVRSFVGVSDSGLNLSLGSFFAGASFIMGSGLQSASQIGNLGTAVSGMRFFGDKIPFLSNNETYQKLFGESKGSINPSQKSELPGVNEQTQ
jgi:hypothetical protein